MGPSGGRQRGAAEVTRICRLAEAREAGMLGSQEEGVLPRDSINGGIQFDAVAGPAERIKAMPSSGWRPNELKRSIAVRHGSGDLEATGRFDRH
jgi:hypothetical protein